LLFIVVIIYRSLLQTVAKIDKMNGLLAKVTKMDKVCFVCYFDCWFWFSQTVQKQTFGEVGN